MLERAAEGPHAITSQVATLNGDHEQKSTYKPKNRSRLELSAKNALLPDGKCIYCRDDIAEEVNDMMGSSGDVVERKRGALHFIPYLADTAQAPNPQRPLNSFFLVWRYLLLEDVRDQLFAAVRSQVVKSQK